MNLSALLGASQERISVIAMEKTNGIDTRNLKVGDLMTVYNYETGLVKALLYQRYSGLSAITENGIDLGDMRGTSRTWIIKEVHHNTGMNYDFISHDQLRADFESGYFEPYFEIL